jgi:hypothetical protein
MQTNVSIKSGSLILCNNGCPIAVTNRDLHKGDSNYSTAFTFIIKPPTKGTMLPLRCDCGAIWFDNHRCTNVQHNKDN